MSPREEPTRLGLRAHDLAPLHPLAPLSAPYAAHSNKKIKVHKHLLPPQPVQTSIPPITPAAASTAQLTVVPLAAPVAPVAAAFATDEALEARLSTPALRSKNQYIVYRESGVGNARRARGACGDFAARQGVSVPPPRSVIEATTYLVTVRTTPSAPVATTVARLTAPVHLSAPPSYPSLFNAERTTSSRSKRAHRPTRSRRERSPDRRTRRPSRPHRERSGCVESTCYGRSGVAECAADS